MSPWGFFYHHEASWICKHLFISFPCVAFRLLHADGGQFHLVSSPPAPASPSAQGCSASPPSAGCPLPPARPSAGLPPPTAGRIKSSEKGLLGQKINSLTSGASASAPLHAVILGKDTSEREAHSFFGKCSLSSVIGKRKKEKRKNTKGNKKKRKKKNQPQSRFIPATPRQEREGGPWESTRHTAPPCHLR